MLKTVLLPKLGRGGCALFLSALLSGFASTSVAQAIPATDYNGDLLTPSQCIPVKDATKPVEVFLSNGLDTTYRLDGLRNWQRGACLDGSLRIQPYETLNIAGRATWYHRGASGMTNQDSKVIRPGHVSEGDLLREPVKMSPGKLGQPCAGATDTLYRNNPEGSPGLGTIPIGLYYKDPVENDGSPSWGHYGNPAQQQGSYRPPGLHWNYLLWNWPTYETSNTNTVRGGGQARASMKRGEYIRRCDDVASITSPAWDNPDPEVPVVLPRPPVAEVRGVYGRIRLEDGTAVYGWFAHSWRMNSWNPGTWSYLVEPACCLETDHTLRQDEVLSSDNGQYKLTMQLDGNLVMYGPSGPVWSSVGAGGSYCNNCGAYAIMQQDGNLVVYTASGSVLWASVEYAAGSNCSGCNPRLVVQNDANLVIYGNSGQVLFHRW
jgi:hypothetical protein